MTVIWMKRYLSVFAIGVMVMAAGASLMMVSQRVYEKQKNVQALNRQAVHAEWEIRALKAELAYLTRPERLTEIASAMGGASANANILGGNVAIVMPVAYDFDSSSSPSQSIIPPLKPTYVALSKPSITTTSQTPTTKAQGDFLSLINTIGTE